MLEVRRLQLRRLRRLEWYEPALRLPSPKLSLKPKLQVHHLTPLIGPLVMQKYSVTELPLLLPMLPLVPSRALVKVLRLLCFMRLALAAATSVPCEAL